jgi:hypothetical protein
MNSTSRSATPSTSRSSRLGIPSHRLSSVRKQVYVIYSGCQEAVCSN